MIRLTFILVFICTNMYGQTAASVNANQFKSLLDSIPSAIIIDLRTPSELKSGIIPNAINIDYFAKDFEIKISNLDPTKSYFLYCAGGGRSGETFELMGKKGFQTVYNLDGGFTAWKKAGLPVTDPKRK